MLESERSYPLSPSMRSKILPRSTGSLLCAIGQIKVTCPPLWSRLNLRFPEIKPSSTNKYPNKPRLLRPKRWGRLRLLTMSGTIATSYRRMTGQVARKLCAPAPSTVQWAQGIAVVSALSASLPCFQEAVILLGTVALGITWEQVRNAHPQSSPRPFDSEYTGLVPSYVESAPECAWLIQ